MRLNADTENLWRERTLARVKNIKKFISYDLSDIDEIKMLVFIVNPSLEKSVKESVGALGGRVLSVKKGTGIARNRSFVFGEEYETYVIFAIARKQDADNINIAIAVEHNFDLPNTGLGFVIDVDGYLGAKGVLTE